MDSSSCRGVRSAPSTRAPVTRSVRKRPAAARGRDAGEYSSAAVPATYEASDLQGVPRMKEVEERDLARIPLDGDGPPGLPWADHVVHTLVSNGHLPSSALNQIELQVWSDCSGEDSEKLAWDELRDTIRRIIGADVVVSLYYTCDSDPKSIAFAQANNRPQHVGSNMLQKIFTRGDVGARCVRGLSHSAGRCGLVCGN